MSSYHSCKTLFCKYIDRSYDFTQMGGGNAWKEVVELFDDLMLANGWDLQELEELYQDIAKDYTLSDFVCDAACYAIRTNYTVQSRADYNLIQNEKIVMLRSRTATGITMVVFRCMLRNWKL